MMAAQSSEVVCALSHLTENMNIMLANIQNRLHNLENRLKLLERRAVEQAYVSQAS